MQIRVTRIWQARGDNNLASAISRGPVAVLLYNFHGVSVEGYKSGTNIVTSYGGGGGGVCKVKGEVCEVKGERYLKWGGGGGGRYLKWKGDGRYIKWRGDRRYVK